MAKIINKVSGEEVADILTNHSMTLDEAINIVGEIDNEATEENVKIGDDLFYYDDLELVYEEEKPGITDFETSVSALYDGGWRSSDDEIPVEDMTNAELLEAAEAEDFWTEEASQEFFKRAGIDGSDESTFAELGKSKDRVEPDELFELAKKRLGL